LTVCAPSDAPVTTSVWSFGSSCNRPAACARGGSVRMSERIGQPVTFSFARWFVDTCSAVCLNWQQTAST
jgi:hypothetical protein